eukprot:5290628-Alexandrium_andersonii.AAC.1
MSIPLRADTSHEPCCGDRLFPNVLHLRACSKTLALPCSAPIKQPHHDCHGVPCASRAAHYSA